MDRTKRRRSRWAPAPERFWMRVDTSGPPPPHRPELGPCWRWTGGRSDTDYGHLLVDGRYEGAHRFAYRLLIGPIPEGAHVLHRCDTPACVNPAHLLLGDRSANMRDCARKGRLAAQRYPDRCRPRCPPERLPRGENHHQAVLTEAAVRAIRALADRVSQRALARRYRVSRRTIARVLAGRTWAHVR